MASRIKLKRSLTPNSAPTTSDLTDKEVALNIVDRTLFVNNAGTIEEIANADPNDEKIVPSMFSSTITDGVGNTWYVSKNGTDKATLGSVNPRYGETTGANVWGKTSSTSFATLKYCLDNYAQSGDTVVISSGTYDEIFPLTVPPGVSIKGAGLKSTFIKPTVPTNTEDAFLIEGDCNIEDLCVNDFYYDSVGDTGYAFRLKSTYTVASGGRRPYIQRVSVITKGSTTSGADPYGYAAGDAGRGALVDGSIVDASSTEAALLFNECTFIVPNSVGLYLKNGARCEWLNSFTYFAADSIKGENPGGSGFKGSGKTRLKLNGVLGTFNATDTITYYDVDGTTVLASGTIDSNDGTYIYIDGQGTGQFVEAEAQTAGKLVTANGDAQLDQDIKYFGTASLLLDGVGDYLSLAGSSDFGFGTSDFTVEAFVRPTTVTGTAHIYDSRSGAGDVAGRLYLENGQVRYAVGGTDIVTSGATTLSASTWYHVAVVRNSSTTKIYIDGVERGSAADSNDLGSSRALYIGANFAASNPFTGNIDELRVSKGLARYTSTPFTVTTSEFVVDTNTQLLLHFNGLDGSTDILDGSVSVQDVRSSSGGTAGYITLADYTDFGAELRSIGSASVYGERGITADGKGVRLRCIVHNFGYIGVGADTSNDISGVNQANEIVEANGGRALFTSMDQNGDFRVGNAFFVDQENGTVSFVGGTSGGGTTFDQLIVTGTGNTTTILPTSISLGNLQLSGNTLESLLGNLVLDAPGGSSVQVDKRLLLSNGTYAVPSLAFTNDPDTGIARTQPLSDGEFSLISNGSESARVSNDAVKFFKTTEIISVGIGTAQGDTSINSRGSGYPFGTFSNVPLKGGSGTGAKASITTSAFTGSITSQGSGYPTGTLSNINLVNVSGSGTGGVVNVTVSGISGVITNPGSGYTDGVYNSVPLQGGSGSGAFANLTISGGIVTDVTFVGSSTGYVIGNTLSVNNADLTYGDPPQTSGGSGFQFEIQANQDGDGPGEVVAINPVSTWQGIGYQSGNIISISTASGSGFEYTLSSAGRIETATITNSGADYVEGDIVSPSVTPNASNDSVDGILRTVNYYVSIGDDNGNPVFTIADGPSATPVNNPALNLLRNTVYNFIFQDPGELASYPFLLSSNSGNTVPYTALTESLQSSTGLQVIIDSPTVDVVVDGQFPQNSIDIKLKDTSAITAGASISGTGIAGGEVILAKSGNLITLTSQTGTTAAIADGTVLTVTLPTTIYYYSNVQGNMGNSATISSAYGTGGQIEVVNLNDGTTTTITGSNISGSTIDISGSSNLGPTQITGRLDVSTNAEIVGTLTAGTLVANTVVNQSSLNTTGNIVQTWNDSTDPENIITYTNFAAKVDDPNFKFVTVNTDTSYYNFEVDGKAKVSNSVYLATLESGKVGIGVEPEIDTITTPPTVGEIGEKVEIVGNVKVTGRYLSSDGGVSSPEITFQDDNRLGFYRYLDGSENTLGITTSKGKSLSISGTVNTFHKDVNFVSSLIGEFTLNRGTEYTVGDYQDVEFQGGSGYGAIGNVIVAFDTVLNNPGAGYSDETYINVPLSYAVLPGGNITGFTNLAGGSGYVNGTYSNVSLFGGSGVGATANFTVSGGVVTNLVVNNGGSGYSNTDTGLTVDPENIGGSILTNVTLINGGSGYYNGNYTNLPIANVSSNGANGTVDVTVVGGTVTSVTVNNGGGGYTATDQFTVLTQYLNPQQNLTTSVTNNASNDFVFSGDITGNDPAITVTEGDVITFNVNASGHPFRIVSQLGAGGSYDMSYDVNSVTGQGSEVGTVTFDTGALDAGPGTYYYVCENHPTSMVGTITVNTATVGSGLAFNASTVSTGSGFSVDVASTGTAGVQGTGATATILVENGEVTDFYVTSVGDGNYQAGQVLYVATPDMQYIDPFGTPTQTATPTTEFRVTVGDFGAVTFVELTALGNGYELNDQLSLPDTFRPSTIEWSDSLTVSVGNYIIYQNNIYLVSTGGVLSSTPPTHTTGSVQYGTAFLDFYSVVGVEFYLQVDTLDEENTVQITQSDGGIVAKTLEVTGGLTLGEVAISSNTISRATPGNLVINSGVNGFVEFGGTSGIILPKGTTDQRPANQAGTIRYNIEENIFEGNNGSAFVSLGGVRDVDLDTFIRPESSPGEDDDILEFFVAGVITQRIGETFLETNNITQHRITDLNNVSLWVEGTAVVSPTDPITFEASTAINDNTETITFTAHSFVQGEEVTYNNGGNTDLANLVDGTNYFVNIVDENTINLATSSANIGLGTFIDLTAASATETHSLTRINPAPLLYYYGDNVYSVTSSGTFDADPVNYPDHTTGSLSNGTATLTWERTIYGDLTVSGKIYNFTLDELTFNGSLAFTADNTTARIIGVNTNLDTQFRLSGVDETFIRTDNTGKFKVNTSFASQAETYVDVFEYDLKKFTLADTKIVSNEGTIDTSVGSSLNLTIQEYDVLNSRFPAKSGKVMFEIYDDSATPRRQYSEVSFLLRSDGSDVFYTESNKIYTDDLLVDVSVDIDAQNNVVANIADVTGSNTVIYTVKVVSQSILT